MVSSLQLHTWLKKIRFLIWTNLRLPLLEAEFADVELLLSEHHHHGPDEINSSSEAFLETDVPEVLQVSWREKRAELSKLQKARKFTAAKELRRSFRVEVEELKRKTKCHRCGKQGHWSRECKQPRKDFPSEVQRPARALRPLLAPQWEQADQFDFVAAVEHLVPHSVAWVGRELTMLEQLRERTRSRTDSLQTVIENEVLLVSSPGFGVLDSGCGRTIIGLETLSEFEKMLHDRNMPQPSRRTEYNSFRFGNGATEISTEVAMLPCFLGWSKGCDFSSSGARKSSLAHLSWKLCRHSRHVWTFRITRSSCLMIES